MKRIMILILVIFAIIAVFIYVDRNPIIASSILLNKNPANSARVCLKDLCLDVEIASTPEEKARGLMYRDSLEDGKGILFLFDSESRHGFWMKNMKFPIDMIWVNSDREIVYIERSVPPCREEPCTVYRPSGKAKYVLETRANFTGDNGIGVGTGVRIYTS